jgi:hypothetical protein
VGKVFISYSHNTLEHSERVVAPSNQLRVGHPVGNARFRVNDARCSLLDPSGLCRLPEPTARRNRRRATTVARRTRQMEDTLRRGRHRSADALFRALCQCRPSFCSCFRLGGRLASLALRRRGRAPSTVLEGYDGATAHPAIDCGGTTMFPSKPLLKLSIGPRCLRCRGQNLG